MLLNSDHVTRLILLQQLHKLLALDDPEFVAVTGGRRFDAAAQPLGRTGQCLGKIFSGIIMG
jgi:hypothetical protein